MLVFGSLRRRRFVSKFAMADSSTSIGDVSPASQGHRAGERHGRFGPFDWRSDSERAHSCERIENPDEILSAIPVFIKPGFSRLISHRQNTVVTLLAEFVNGPR